MYVAIVNPIAGEKTHVSPAAAERLVYFGQAAYIGEGRRAIRYFADEEIVALRRELSTQYERLDFERAVQVGRGGVTLGVWRPSRTAEDSGTHPGAPQERTCQFEMTLQAVAASRRTRLCL